MRPVPQVRELVHAVRPEVVMVELCKDRIDLLIDDKVPKYSTWHSRKVRALTQPPHTPHRAGQA